MKQCSKCLLLKPFSDFSPDKKNKSGLRSPCKKCSLEMHKRWLSTNKDKMAKIKSSWRRNNLDKCREQKRRARKRNPGRIDELNSEYRKRNPVLIKAINCNAKARTKFSAKNICTKKLVSLFNSANGICQYCGSRDRKLTFDHKTAMSRGGVHDIENIAIVCLSCNCRKRALSLSEFKEYCRSNSINLII